MRARLAQAAPLLSLLTALFASSPLFAQIPPCLERRLPIPSWAADVLQRPRDPEPPKQMVSIESVTFEGEFPWPAPIRAEITKELTRRLFDASTDWVNELEEIIVRGILQDRGYFRATPKATLKVLKDDPLRPSVAVTLRDNELVQFRLGELRFRNSEPDSRLVFSREQLAKAFPLHSGEIFNVAKVREGLEAFRRMYGASGYIDFTATPLSDIEDDRRVVNLTLELDEQKQFRIEKVEVFGLKPDLEKLLRESVRLNAPFNNELLEKFFKENRASLPAGATIENTGLERDLRNGTVSLLFDFRPCPPFNPPPTGSP